MPSQFEKVRMHDRGSWDRMRSRVVTMAIMVLAVILAFAIFEAVS